MSDSNPGSLLLYTTVRNVKAGTVSLKTHPPIYLCVHASIHSPTYLLVLPSIYMATPSYPPFLSPNQPSSHVPIQLYPAGLTLFLSLFFHLLFYPVIQLFIYATSTKQLGGTKHFFEAVTTVLYMQRLLNKHFYN